MMLNARLIFASLFFFFCCYTATIHSASVAGIFTESLGPFQYPAYYDGYNRPEQASWGDFNADGFLDIALSTVSPGMRKGPAEASTLIFQNLQGNGSFTTLRLPGNESFQDGSSAEWLDYNNDGILDIFFGGDYNQMYAPCLYGQEYLRPEKQSTLWQGAGDGSFSLAASFGFYCVASAVWGDFNNDGFVDLFIVGSTTNYYENTPAVPDSAGAQLWLNIKGTGAFVALSVPAVAALANGDVCAGDYDNDGWLDLYVSGTIPQGFNKDKYEPRAFLLHNKGVGTTTTTSSINGVLAVSFELGGGFPLPNTVGIFPGSPSVGSSMLGSCAWGDFNADGRLDLFVTGSSEGGPLVPSSTLWINNGTNFFTSPASRSQTVPNVTLSTVRWGDYDNDGLPDLCLTGTVMPLIAGNGTIILHNNNSVSFTDAFFVSDAGVGGACIWGDYNNDGRLDFFTTSVGGGSLLFTNNVQTAGSAPSPPTNVNVSFTSEGVLWITWSPPSSASGKSFTYNVGISGGVLSPLSLASGQRLVAAPGNAGPNTFMKLYGLTSQNYAVQVQTIDAAYRGSSFATFSYVAPSHSTSSAERVVPLFSSSLTHLLQ